MSWRTKWRIYEYIRNSIWIVPAILGGLAIAMGITFPDLDERATTTIGIAYSSGAAEGMLGAMAGGMITFTGFVFSILLLAVQFGSSQFSPRMLRRFLRDPTTKISLGIFMATFLYALLVLRTIGEAGNEDFVPNNSISISLLLLLLSMIMFLRLISKTTQGLRVAVVVGDLGRDGAAVMQRVYPEPVEGPEAGGIEEVDGGEGAAEPSRVVTYGQEPAVLQSADTRGLVAIAAEADVVVVLIPPVGDLLAWDSPLFAIHGDGDAIDDERLRSSIAVGDERTMRQDPAFVFRLLADISSKALSPGVNDPTTSVQSLDQIEMLLQLLAGRRLTPGELRDEAGVVRLRYPAPTWEDFLSIALDEARFFGETSVQVTRRLRALLEDLHAAAPPYRQPAVEAQIRMLEASVARSFREPADHEIAAARDRQGIGSPGGR
ncbi:MAG: DUF2254 domain-containing protein [Thermoleophilia bacterium]|nr:DUF2254 domain-containing protein [Thermoleophilia bacterium]